MTEFFLNEKYPQNPLKAQISHTHWVKLSFQGELSCLLTPSSARGFCLESNKLPP